MCVCLLSAIVLFSHLLQILSKHSHAPLSSFIWTDGCLFGSKLIFLRYFHCLVVPTCIPNLSSISSCNSFSVHPTGVFPQYFCCLKELPIQLKNTLSRDTQKIYKMLNRMLSGFYYCLKLYREFTVFNSFQLSLSFLYNLQVGIYLWSSYSYALL